jgi:DNA-binding response OmpR family regulator
MAIGVNDAPDRNARVITVAPAWRSVTMPAADEPESLHILIVEDDPMIGMLLGEMLEAMGHRVCAIEMTEAAAVAAALAHRPDVMIVDALLFDGSGVGAVTTIRKTIDIACVFVSGDVSEINTTDADAVILSKPYNEAGLVGAIDAARAAARARAAP